MSASLQEISQKLGISVSSVSRALAGKAGVAKAKREKIVNLAQELGYQPDVHASNLRRKKGIGVTVIAPFQASQIVHQRNEQFFQLARGKYKQVKILPLNMGESLDQALKAAISAFPEAIVISSLYGEVSDAVKKLLKDKKIACVSMDSSIEEIDSIDINRAKGTYQATKLLHSCGCKNMKFFSSCPLDRPDYRLKGIIKAMSELGQPLTEENLVIFQGNNYQGGYEHMKNLLASHDLDGVFAYNDQMALGGLRAIVEHGIRVPEEIRLIGFDNIDISEYSVIPLTTVAQPVEEIAVRAMEILELRKTDFDMPVVKEVLDSKLVIRQSCPLPSHESRKLIFNEPILSTH